MFHLLANNGPQAGHKYELKGDLWILGRHPDCHIVIEVGAVSRNHCQVVRDGDQYFLEDLGSRNGTFLNEETDKIVGRRLLHVGDVIRVCEVSFTVGSDGPKPSPAGTAKVGGILDGAGLGAFLSDDEAATTSSTIMSKLERSSSQVKSWRVVKQSEQTV